MPAQDRSKIAAEDSFSAEEKIALQELLDEYKAASQKHIPGYTGGGLARKIAVALVQNGWRKQIK